MKNAALICLILIVTACSGKLSEEDRKALHDEMEQREIRQIRDDDIVSRALDLGKEMRTSDSLIATLDAGRMVYTERPENDEMLMELWDAYRDAYSQGMSPDDNIQRDYPDDLVYTYAEITGDSVMKMTAIRIPKSSVVSSL